MSHKKSSRAQFSIHLQLGECNYYANLADLDPEMFFVYESVQVHPFADNVCGDYSVKVIHDAANHLEEYPHDGVFFRPDLRVESATTYVEPIEMEEDEEEESDFFAKPPFGTWRPRM